MTKQVRAKKNLGQHFLTNLEAAERIAHLIDKYKGTPVLEIGPGMGVLTRPLEQLGHNLYVLDIDHESIEYLHQTFPTLSAQKRIIQGDFLHLPAEDFIPQHPDTTLVIIGNYPYNISSQIFFRVLDHKERIPCICGMLQKEVAVRLCASPGNRDYGILSVLLQCWYHCRYVFTVSHLDFNPPPKVDGGVLILERNSRSSIPCSEENFKRVIKTAFGQRRKTLRNALMGLFGKDYDYTSEPMFALRAERLSPDDFIHLAQLYEALPSSMEQAKE